MGQTSFRTLVTNRMPRQTHEVLRGEASRAFAEPSRAPEVTGQESASTKISETWTRLQAGQGYGNTLNCVLTVYRNESVAGFFKGMAFPLASIAVYNSVVFGVFSNTQRLLSQLRYGDAARAPALSDMALASAVAGFVSVGIGTPVDLIKIRLQMQTQPLLQANVKLKPMVPGFPVYRGPIHCFRTVLQKEGIAGLYRGAGAMLLRDVPGYCLYFIPYAFFCGWITPDGSISPNPSSVWLAGGVAGAISWGTATPMDVVKSRLQADGVYVNKYKGILDCILQSYQSEGLKTEVQVNASMLSYVLFSCLLLSVQAHNCQVSEIIRFTNHLLNVQAENVQDKNSVNCPCKEPIASSCLCLSIPEGQKRKSFHQQWN
ncbi:solute carrier family 25 member 48 isoform X4 [Rhea pennata]|uniref:solute carrier family 25 member 48 isoform X4 n=1 Tax=Rhea pennata TaxID=8795 RepID=UPI002E25A4DB